MINRLISSCAVKTDAQRLPFNPEITINMATTKSALGSSVNHASCVAGNLWSSTGPETQGSLLNSVETSNGSPLRDGQFMVWKSTLLKESLFCADKAGARPEASQWESVVAGAEVRNRETPSAQVAEGHEDRLMEASKNVLGATGTARLPVASMGDTDLLARVVAETIAARSALDLGKLSGRTPGSSHTTSTDLEAASDRLTQALINSSRLDLEMMVPSTLEAAEGISSVEVRVEDVLRDGHFNVSASPEVIAADRAVSEGKGSASVKASGSLKAKNAFGRFLASLRISEVIGSAGQMSPHPWSRVAMVRRTASPVFVAIPHHQASSTHSTTSMKAAINQKPSFIARAFKALGLRSYHLLLRGLSLRRAVLSVGAAGVCSLTSIDSAAAVTPDSFVQVRADLHSATPSAAPKARTSAESLQAKAAEALPTTALTH